MDRRTRRGPIRALGSALLGLAALVGPVGAAPLPQRNPDDLGRVGSAPIEPISNPLQRGSGSTTDPVGSPAAASPPATERLGWFARRRQARTRPSSAVGRTEAVPATGRVAPPPAVAGAPADALTVPARLGWVADTDIPAAPGGRPATVGDRSAQDDPQAGPVEAVPGRPAPFAGQVPTGPRRQALGGGAPSDPDEALLGGPSPPIGRPAPRHANVPQRPRPNRPADPPTDPKPRPRLAAEAASGPVVAPGPGPAIPATLPDLDQTPGPLALPAIEPPPALDPVTLPDPAELPQVLPTARAGNLSADGPEAKADPRLLPTADAVASEPVKASISLATVPPRAESPPAEVDPRSPQVVPPTDRGINPGRSDSRPDPAVRQTSVSSGTDPTALRIDDRAPTKNRPLASGCAARVGDSVITMSQVEALVTEEYQKMTQGQVITDQDRRDVLNMLGQQALEHLIQQEMILLKAHALIKNPKAKAGFDEFVDKRWREDQLPFLLRKYTATNEADLRQKLTERGQSYVDMKNRFADEMLMHDFLYSQLKSNISVELMQQRKYYMKHLDQYQQPASLSWRELEVSVDKYPDRAAARQAAEALGARLARGEDFAALARTASDGPTASLGGLFANKTPGNYGIAPVNEVLGTIPTGQISPVIEAPTSFHIVRVESRREAGPRHFDEVQKDVSKAVFAESFEQARTAYIARLRRETLVRINPIFQQPEKPAGRPDVDPAVRAASAP